VKVAPVLGMQGRRLLIRTYIDEKMGGDTAKYMTDFRRIENSLVQEAITQKRIALPEDKAIIKPNIIEEIFLGKPSPPVTKKLPKLEPELLYKPFGISKYPSYPVYPSVGAVPFLIGYPKSDVEYKITPIPKTVKYPARQPTLKRIAYPTSVSSLLLTSPLPTTPPTKYPSMIPPVKYLPIAPPTKYPTKQPIPSLKFIPPVYKKPPEPYKIPVRFPRLKTEKKRIDKIRRPQGYYAYGKPIRQKKYVRLNKQPLTKIQALSLGSHLADTSLSRTFKIEKTSKAPKPSTLKFPPNYFLDNQRKFRGYQLKKGKKIPMKDKYIERNPFLLDTRQEVQKIGLLKRLAQLRAGSGFVKRKVKSKKAKPKNKKINRKNKVKNKVRKKSILNFLR
ncbi:MAG TPA: hypothetical protein VMV95_00475, partial [Bacillota bacterium]|nr:hypothetical protein [Bacillota bacterium]